MMRIAHVTDHYHPRLGGIEMQVDDLAARQRAAGHDVHIITSHPPAKAADGSWRPDPPWVHRVRGEIANQTIRPVVAGFSAPEILTPRSYDAVHMHASVLSPFTTMATRAAIRSRIPTTVTIHSLWAGLGPIPRLADLSMRLRSWPVVWTGVSHKAAAPLRRALGPNASVSVLPNGVDPADWFTEPANRDPNTVVIASVMRLARRKRPMQLLRMLRQLRAITPADIAIEAVIIGDGPMRSSLARYLNRHDMSAWVSLPGRLERSDIRAVYGATDIYVGPAILESFGIAVLEARCAGLPVVASLLGGVPDFIHHGREGLLTASDADMVDALATLVTSPSLRDDISHHNRLTPPAVSWPEVLRKADLLYAEAASLCSPRRTLLGVSDGAALDRRGEESRRDQFASEAPM
ncbi:MAG: glycosyltransferase family 4 protein [Nocardioidaceae bacterium]